MAAPITGPLADMFSDLVTVSPYTGQDQYGTETYASGTARAARVMAGGEHAVDPTGQEFITRGKVIFADTFGVKRGDRLTMPADFDPEIVYVRAAFTVRDESGPHHDWVLV